TLFAILLTAPLIGFFINGANFRGHNAKLAGTIATAMVAISFACAIMLVRQLMQLPEGSREVSADFFRWITLGELQVQARFLIDPISAIMVLVVTGVGSLIHLFSVGYMSHDERPAKYF